MPAVPTIAWVSLALLTGGILWVGLFFRQRRRPMTRRTLFFLVLVTGLLCRLGFVFFTPTFHAPDEQAHFNYIKHLVEQRTLPVQTTKMGDPANEWEYFQPPLYYVALVPVYWLAQVLGGDVAAVVVALRLCSVLLWLVNVWFGVRLLDRLQVRDEGVWLLVMGMVCLLPTYVFVSSAINNDNLLAAWGGGFLSLLARREDSTRHVLLVGLWLGLGLLVKQSAVVFVPAVILLVGSGASAARWERWRQGLLALGVAGLIFLPWALRNWRIYGTFSPEHLSAAALTWPSLLHGVASAAHNLVKTFWAVSGISNEVGYPFPLAGFALLILWLVGLNAGLTRERQTDPLNAGKNRDYYGALWLSGIVAVLLVAHFGFRFGMGQGRHLFPLLYPFGLLLAAGCHSLPIRPLAIHASGFWITYAVGFVVFSLSRFPR